MSSASENQTDRGQQHEKERNALVSQLKGDGVQGISVLTDNEANLDETDRALLKRFNENAQRMGIHPAPKLILYEKASGDDSPNAFSGMLGGVYIVGISQSARRADLELGIGADFVRPPLERLVAVAAHEEAHIKRKDGRPNARGQHPGLDSINVELASDKEGVRATCDAQASEEDLKLAYLAEARAAGTTVDAIVQAEMKDSSDWTHPLLPTRLAHLEYLKAHPPRGCKGKR